MKFSKTLKPSIETLCLPDELASGEPWLHSLPTAFGASLETYAACGIYTDCRPSVLENKGWGMQSQWLVRTCLTILYCENHLMR
nr:hypothetical protein [Sunxiuqinia sp.]